MQVIYHIASQVFVFHAWKPGQKLANFSQRTIVRQM